MHGLSQNLWRWRSRNFKRYRKYLGTSCWLLRLKNYPEESCAKHLSCAVLLCFFVCSLLQPAKVILSSKSCKKSLKKMFPFTLQLLGIILDFFCFVLCSCFAAAVGNRRFLSLLKQLSEATEKILISCGFVRFR